LTDTPPTSVTGPVVADVSSSSAFTGTWVMGSPTADGVTFNLHSTDQAGLVAIDYGVTSLQYTQQLPTSSLEIDKPLELRLQNLKPGTRYFYRLLFQNSASKQWTATPEYEFQTAKQAGQPFVFAIQGDSHPERLNSMQICTSVPCCAPLQTSQIFTS
jgi:phosphodiesterase/alkaline phosphatase D-like protein